MENNQSSMAKLSFFISFLVAYLGSKGIFYYFAFEYSLFYDAFNIQKLFIDLGVFAGLFFLSEFLLNPLIPNKNKPV
ncbi:hypothetical protein [Colwellia sp. MEBiC06753]